MLNGRPDVLQGCTHLDFKAYVVQLRIFRVIENFLGNTANVVQRVIAEAVGFVHLALIYRVGPVNLKYGLGKGGHAIYVFVIEHDDTRSENVRNIL